MKEAIKKIAKIIGIVFIVLIVLLIVFAVIRFTLGTTSSMIRSDAYDDYDGLAGAPMESASFAADMGLSSASVPASAGKTIASVFSGSTNNKQAVNTNTAGGNFNEGELTQKKVIKNAQLTLYVKDAEESAKQIQAMTKALGGFVSESNIYESNNGYKSGTITIRIPVDKFESTLSNVRQLAVEVDHERITAQDVTEEYVDLEAQIRNLKAEEKQYLEIMQKSYTIDDTLKVSSRLSDVRGRIERAQGRMNYLSRQVDMSTIRINLSADADIKVFGLRWRPLIVTKRAFKSMLEGLTGYVDAMIMFIFKLPVILLWIATITAILFVLAKFLRFLYRKIIKPHHHPQLKKEEKSNKQAQMQP